MWDIPTVNQDSQYENGQKGAFTWFPYEYINKECKFIGITGYMTVKVFIASELFFPFDKVGIKSIVVYLSKKWR